MEDEYTCVKEIWSIENRKGKEFREEIRPFQNFQRGTIDLWSGNHLLRFSLVVFHLISVSHPMMITRSPFLLMIALISDRSSSINFFASGS